MGEHVGDASVLAIPTPLPGLTSIPPNKMRKKPLPAGPTDMMGKVGAGGTVTPGHTQQIQHMVPWSL